MASRYLPTTLGPTDGQMSDLAEGHTVSLGPSHVKGDVLFHLTPAQIAKIDRALENGRGCTLKFSAAQIKHHHQHGSGMFTDLLKSGAKILYGAAKPHIKTGLAKGAAWAAGKVMDKVEDVAGLKGDGLYLSGRGLTKTEIGHLRAMENQHGRGFFGDLLKKVAHGGVDFIADKIGGGVASPVQYNELRKIHRKYGSGFFGDLLKKVAHGGVDMLAGALGGGVGSGISHTHRQQLEEMRAHHGAGFFDFVKSIFGGGVGVEPNEFLQAALHQKKVPIRQ